MATALEFIEFVMNQLRGENAQYEKMFGEYVIYIDGKPVFTVCDNLVFVKKLDELKELMTYAETDIPYEGAEEHYILELQNVELVRKVTAILKEVIPVSEKMAKKA